VDASHKKTGVVNLYGATTVTTPFDSVTLPSPGTYVESSGGHVSDVMTVPPELLARFQALLGSKRDQTAGTRPGLITSQTLRQIVTSSGPPTNHSSNLSEEQLQFIASIRPQLESITAATHSAGGSASGSGNMCASDPDDCDRDHHHHHQRHDHDHDHDRDHDSGHDHDYDHHHGNVWHDFPHSGPPGWRVGGHGSIRSDLGPLGVHGHGWPSHVGPTPTHVGVPHHP